MNNSKDLFDDSTMSFGEHLETLRVHLWKAIIGLVLATIICLCFGQHVVTFIRGPITAALREYNFPNKGGEITKFNFIDYMNSLFSGDEYNVKEKEEEKVEKEPVNPTIIVVTIKQADLYEALKKIDPKLVADTEQPDPEKTLQLQIQAKEFEQLQILVESKSKTVALNVQEAFMTYLKVSLVAGFLLASPWIFYQTWLFVSAGLYPHERKYVYVFLPMSLGLFLGGALFCFYLVFPTVLDFLLQFNKSIGVEPQIRLSEWISFAIMLPMMFGISFQLPLVMLFLERIQIFTTEQYRTNRRMSVLVIAIISMMLTPADPTSMVLMMVPLVILYEVGIKLCAYRTANTTPFSEAET